MSSKGRKSRSGRAGVGDGIGPSDATARRSHGGHSDEPLPPTNTFAVFALVTGIFGLSLLAVILGHVSLRQIARTRQRGRGMAIAGTVLGYLGLVIAVTVVIIVMVGYNTMMAEQGV